MTCTFTPNMSQKPRLAAEARQIGGAVVLAVVTAILTSAGAGQAQPGQPLPGMTTAIGVIVAVTLTAFVLTLFQLRDRTSQP